MTSTPETAFLLQRAEQEAIRAICADREAAAAHFQLSVRYSARALRALVEGDSRHAMETDQPT